MSPQASTHKSMSEIGNAERFSNFGPGSTQKRLLWVNRAGLPRSPRLPVYPQLRTCLRAAQTVAKGQKLTLSVGALRGDGLCRPGPRAMVRRASTRVPPIPHLRLSRK